MSGPGAAGTGSWRNTYTRRRPDLTATHTGGPADGTRVRVPGSPVPQARFYATTAARRGRTVQLARYVMHVVPEHGQVIYRYTGMDERAGPVPGMRDSPAWSE